MERYKISKFDSILSKFMTRKWIEIKDLLGGWYSSDKNTRFETFMRRSNLCDYVYTCIFVKASITVKETNNVDEKK